MAEKRNHKFQQGKVVPVQKKAKVEYMTKDLSSSWSLDLEKKHNEMIEELNRLGNDGWILISGIENLKYATFMRIIYCEDDILYSYDSGGHLVDTTKSYHQAVGG